MRVLTIIFGKVSRKGLFEKSSLCDQFSEHLLLRKLTLEMQVSDTRLEFKKEMTGSLKP